MNRLTAQTGAPFVIEMSYDDGATWRRTPLVPTGGDSWVALLLHPRKDSVSLRAGATFADGARWTTP